MIKALGNPQKQGVLPNIYIYISKLWLREVVACTPTFRKNLRDEEIDQLVQLLSILQGLYVPSEEAVAVFRGQIQMVFFSC